MNNTSVLNRAHACVHGNGIPAANNNPANMSQMIVAVQLPSRRRRNSRVAYEPLIDHDLRFWEKSA
ncbi:MAG: hypothetical protein ACLTNK_00555 [Akkermansia muciniphila]